MSPPSDRRAAWRAPLAVALAAALTALTAGCGDPPPGPAAPAPGPAAAPAPPGADPAPAPGAPAEAAPRYVTAAQCGQCHREIYEEWRASYHGQAMSDPLFLDLSKDVNKEECIRCHAPVALREVDFQTPIARTELREDAVSCLTCHQTEGGVAGPHGGLTGPCNPIHDPDQTNPVKMCFGCHNQHDTGNEWLAGPYAPDQPEPRKRPVETCLTCHMPEVERPLVPGGPVRKGRRHTWFGGHDIGQLRKAPLVEAEVTPLAGGGFRFQGFVTNVGAGHNIPTDARHRSFDLYLALWDADGRALLNPLDPNQQARAHLAKYRKNYRGTGLLDTQIPPLARVSGLGDRWKGYLDVPEARAGRGEVWLVYRLTPSDVLTAESLLDLPLELYRARLVARAAFTFGP